MKIIKVISGGQTGADIGGLQAAMQCGILTGGWAPAGWLTERGPNQPLLQYYGLVEARGGYPFRTRCNIREADFTLIFAEQLDRGSALTANYANEIGKPLWIHPNISVGAIQSHFYEKKEELIVNVAGNRESRAIGLEEKVRNFMIAFLKDFNQ